MNYSKFIHQKKKMIFKLIILTASIFMIYAFTTSRSTAVAQIEPMFYDKLIFYEDLPKRTYDFLGKEQEAQRLSGYNSVQFHYDGIRDLWQETKQSGLDYFYHPARVFSNAEIANLQKVAMYQEKINDYTISLMLTDKQINTNSWLNLNGV